MQFEERAYGVDMWVCTKQIITDITSDNGMFQKLFDYITGANDRQEKIEMTSPVSTMRQKSTKGEIHEQCFYLYEKDPPKPTNEDVYLVKREAMNVYTRTVMKRMSEKDWLSESASMDKLVASQKLKIKENVWYAAGYSAPFSAVQKNEVWKVKAVKAFDAPHNDLQTPEYKVVKTFESDGEKVIKTNEKSAKKVSNL